MEQEHDLQKIIAETRQRNLETSLDHMKTIQLLGLCCQELRSSFTFALAHCALKDLSALWAEAHPCFTDRDFSAFIAFLSAQKKDWAEFSVQDSNNNRSHVFLECRPGRDLNKFYLLAHADDPLADTVVRFLKGAIGEPGRLEVHRIFNTVERMRGRIFVRSNLDDTGHEPLSFGAHVAIEGPP